jgi:hypothetical protein
MNTSKLGLMMVTIAVTGVVGVAACSSSSGSSTTSTPAAATGKRITAAAGGTVSDPSGTATLTIPPGALDKDTDITLSVLAASGGVLGSVYDFGPNGTTFKTAAKLDIKADAALAPAGKTLAIGIGSGATFVALDGSTSAAGVVSAPVPHFTSFGVIAVGGSTATDAGTDAPVSGGNCAFKGTFTMQKYLCGTTDVTAQWKTVVPTETLVVTDKAGGGCVLAITHTAPVCVEAESFDVTQVSGNSYTFKDNGISSCAPAACKFVTNDAPCVIGDRATTDTRNIVVEGAGFHISRTSAVGDICGGMVEDFLFLP